MTSSVRIEAGAQRRRGGRIRNHEGLWGHLFLLPWLVGFFTLTFGPMIASLYLSFTDYTLLSAPKWAGLSNYKQMFTSDPKYVASVKVTLLYVVLSVPTELIAALLIAVALNRKLRGINFFRSAFYLPSLLGGSVAISVLWRQLFGEDGVLNQLLAVFGITGPAWISQPSTALYTLVVLHVWQFGAPMLIFLAGLQQIPDFYYDAAKVDGASRFRTFIHITLPLLTPITFFNLILRIISAFQAFTPAFIISGGSGHPGYSLLFYTLYLYQQGFGSFHMGYAAAMAWVLFIVVACFSAANFFLSRYWVHYES